MCLSNDFNVTLLNLISVAFCSVKVHVISLVLLGLNLTSHWLAHIHTFVMSLLIATVASSGLSNSIKREVSSVNSLMLHCVMLVKSLIWIRKCNGPRTEPWGTPAFINPIVDYKLQLADSDPRDNFEPSLKNARYTWFLSLYIKPFCHTVKCLGDVAEDKTQIFIECFTKFMT